MMNILNENRTTKSITGYTCVNTAFAPVKEEIEMMINREEPRKPID